MKKWTFRHRSKKKPKKNWVFLHIFIWKTCFPLKICKLYSFKWEECFWWHHWLFTLSQKFLLHFSKPLHSTYSIYFWSRNNFLVFNFQTPTRTRTHCKPSFFHISAFQLKSTLLDFRFHYSIKYLLRRKQFLFQRRNDIMVSFFLHKITQNTAITLILLHI